MKVVLITVCKNEESILPFFFRHYKGIVDEYIFFSNDSTDSTTDIINAHPNTRIIPFSTLGYYKEDTLTFIRSNAYRNLHIEADWFLIVDIDEFLWHPDLRGYLNDCKARGITLPKTIGYEIYAETMPDDDGSLLLTDTLKEGWRNDSYSKFSMVTPDVQVNYGPGSHKASPEGNVQYSETAEVRLLHYSYPNINTSSTSSAKHRRASQRCGQILAPEGAQDSRGLRIFDTPERLKYRMPVLPDDEESFYNDTRHEADTGDADALHQLAIMHYLAQGANADADKALQCARMASEQGHTLAAYHAGFMLKLGIGVTADIEEALKQFKIAAENGHTQSQYQLGWMHAHNDSVSDTGNEAYQWLKKAAEGGEKDAQYALSMHCRNGDHSAPHTEESLHWEISAANNGHILAQFNQAAYNYNKKDFIEAFKWATLAARQGLPRAYELIDMLHNMEVGIPNDYEGSEEWFRLRLDRQIADI